ncbi:glycosyltransferase [Cupriavidus basilensis]|uniref:Glycosyltransferase n=1 Tax=Cupriavidus basilensis TaxID=68895 RepID=A0ABT6AZJ5_9BURK|nr:glycosyltransferase [Cupriavidus basilensis]MDF3838043.1 glycosyltransferase [Cupriavidus basilensis]
MITITLAFLVSSLLTFLVVRYSRLHEHFTADWDLQGVQKHHAKPVPRIGGLGIAASLVVVSIITWYRPDVVTGAAMLKLVACAVFAFGAGFWEDLTKSVAPRERLIATMVSALAASWILDARLARVDVALVDQILSITVVSIAITALAVSGLANAINIIDGFNGLASMVSMIMFLSLAYVAFQVGDAFVLTVAFAMIGAIFGFFIWNFPAGTIFLGDGGAYLIGFVLAELAILLIARHPQISAWYPFLMVIYPIFETLFSIYRRKVVRGVPAGHPDGVHLHTLVYKRLMRWAVGSADHRHKLRRNSMTSPYLWLLSLFAVVPATLFWNNGIVLAIFSAVFMIFYVWLYWRIVRFQVPRWMIFRK